MTDLPLPLDPVQIRKYGVICGVPDAKMVQGKKCLAVHSALPPIVFVFLPERIGGEQEHAAEENVQQDKRDVHGNETVNHADNKTQIHSSRGRRIRVPSDQ